MNRFLAGAESVFSFLKATVEHNENGCCWRTYDYSDEPHYHYNIFNGVGGIPIFLCEYYRRTQKEEALTLAEGAIRWCITAKSDNYYYERGLQLGKTGVAYSALLVSELTSNDDFIAFAEENGKHICAENPGPITDFLSGEASNGWFLLKLWRQTGNPQFLHGAIRCAEWVKQKVIRERGLTYCLPDPVQKSFGERAYTGLSHGIAGVAFFLAYLYEQTGETRWSSLSHELLDTLVKTAIEVKDGLNWSPILEETDLTRCQYSHGASGIGLAFSASARCLNDSSLLDIALRAGEAAYNYGDFRNNPTLCTGLAGGGELMLDLYRQTKDDVWRSRAEKFGDLVLRYKSETPSGDRWPTDTEGLYSPDFTYGASGTGYFLLGLTDPLHHSPPLM